MLLKYQWVYWARLYVFLKDEIIIIIIIISVQMLCSSISTRCIKVYIFRAHYC